VTHYDALSLSTTTYIFTRNCLQDRCIGENESFTYDIAIIIQMFTLDVFSMSNFFQVIENNYGKLIRLSFGIQCYVNCFRMPQCGAD
jgi:hypothetical protein